MVVDPAALVLLAVGAGAYAVGVRRLSARGRGWPALRSAAWAAGLFAVAAALLSPLAEHDTTRFSAHSAQHALLGMVAPALLVLGAPLTLALQAAARPTQRVLLRLLHAPPVALATTPVGAWLLFGGTMVALYAGPLLGLSNRNGFVHVTVHLHLLVVGAAFAAATVGPDPIPRRPGHAVRLLTVVLAVPFHAVLGMALLSAGEPLAGGTWSVADQQVGAGILWASGDLFGLLLAGGVLASWMAADDRAAARHDRAPTRTPTAA